MIRLENKGKGFILSVNGKQIILEYFYVSSCNNFVIRTSKLIEVTSSLTVGLRSDNSLGSFDKRRESGPGNKTRIINTFSLGFV